MQTMLDIVLAVVIATGAIIGGVMSIWRCKGTTEKPFRPSNTFSQACSFRSSADLGFRAFNYLPFKENGDNTYTLETAEYGIKGIENTTNFGEDVIRAFLRDNYGLETENMDYLGSIKTEAKVVNIDPTNTGRVLIFQIIFDCWVYRKSESIDNSKDFIVYTGPLLFTFPAVGNCTPKDQYMAHSYSNGVENHENTKINTTGSMEALFVYGVSWNFGHEELTGNDPTAAFRMLAGAQRHQKPPVYSMILEELALKFASLNPSPVTNVSWEKNLTTSLPILKKETLVDFDRTLEPNSKTTFYKLVGVCGPYIVVPKKIYKRVSDIGSGACVRMDGARDGIEKCDFCQKLECADKKDFPKAHEEYHQGLIES